MVRNISITSSDPVNKKYTFANDSSQYTQRSQILDRTFEKKKKNNIHTTRPYKVETCGEKRVVIFLYCTAFGAEAVFSNEGLFIH